MSRRLSHVGYGAKV